VAINVRRLDRVVVVAGDLDALTRFYVGLGFAGDDARAAPEQASLADARIATTRALRLASQIVELVAFDPPGAAYPLPTRSTDPWFQHIALIAPDIEAAMTLLRALGGWTPISRGGMERLPERAGGVSAFKFRDPEGHPLELLAFPAGKAPEPWRGTGPGLLGYDHSAIGVHDVATSIAFWRGEMGLSLGPRTLNDGPEQAALDGLDGPVVDVVAMRPATPTPHVELLGYHARDRARPVPIGARDRAATRLMLAADGVSVPSLTRDPDGHWLHLIPA